MIKVLILRKTLCKIYFWMEQSAKSSAIPIVSLYLGISMYSLSTFSILYLYASEGQHYQISFYIDVRTPCVDLKKI
jgi:hypothetical protein